MKELIQQCRQGDREAMGQLYTAMHDELLAQCRKYAANDIQKYIGQTRVKQFDEVQLATKISDAELESLFESAIRNTTEGQAIQNKMNELKEEKRRIQDED